MKKQISPFTTENAHSQKVIDKLNSIWNKNPDAWWILSEMQKHFDNFELDYFAEHAADNGLAIEYRRVSRQAHCAVAIIVGAEFCIAIYVLLSHTRLYRIYCMECKRLRYSIWKLDSTFSVHAAVVVIHGAIFINRRHVQ